MRGPTVARTSSISDEEKTEELFSDREEPPSSQHPFALPFLPTLNPHPANPLGSIVSFRQLREFTPQIRKFRKTNFPGASDKEWNSWQWQIANRIRTVSRLSKMLNLSMSELQAAEFAGSKLPLGITPYYMSLIDPDNADQPLRRTMVPTMDEFVQSPGESADPLGEEGHSPVPGLVHRYPDRVLALATDFCSAHCRYCTRSRMVGKESLPPGKSRLEKMIAYVRATPTVRDVLISGGDPLTLSDDRLDWLLSSFRSIPHVEILRIGTKIPAVLPQRITTKLTRMLRRHHPLWMSLHFIHPDECTKESRRACERLADAGIPLGSQTVLLKGVNDSGDTMLDLFHQMMKMRVKPYYLYQCDPISGSGHFRTPVEKGVALIRGLRGFTSGYAVPTYVIDAPGGGGKIPIAPDYVKGCGDGNLVLSNYENRLFRYPDPSLADGDIIHEKIGNRQFIGF